MNAIAHLPFSSFILHICIVVCVLDVGTNKPKSEAIPKPCVPETPQVPRPKNRLLSKYVVRAQTTNRSFLSMQVAWRAVQHDLVGFNPTTHNKQPLFSFHNAIHPYHEMTTSR